MAPIFRRFNLLGKTGLSRPLAQDSQKRHSASPAGVARQTTSRGSLHRRHSSRISLHHIPRNFPGFGSKLLPSHPHTEGVPAACLIHVHGPLSARECLHPTILGDRGLLAPQAHPGTFGPHSDPPQSILTCCSEMLLDHLQEPLGEQGLGVPPSTSGSFLEALWNILEKT